MKRKTLLLSIMIILILQIIAYIAFIIYGNIVHEIFLSQEFELLSKFNLYADVSWYIFLFLLYLYSAFVSMQLTNITFIERVIINNGGQIFVILICMFMEIFIKHPDFTFRPIPYAVQSLMILLRSNLFFFILQINRLLKKAK